MYFQRLCFGRAVFWYILLFPLNWEGTTGEQPLFFGKHHKLSDANFQQRVYAVVEAMYRKGWQDAEKLVPWYRAAKAEA